MKVKKVLEAIPRIYDFRYGVSYGRHVVLATPKAIAKKASQQTNANLWGAIINFEEAKRGKKGKSAD